MPNDPGPTSWLADQYQRFLDGIEKVGNPNAPRLVRSQARVRVEPGKQPTINVPAWSDIVRTGPRTPVTDEDWAIQRHFEQAGLPSPLSAEVQNSIRDRREIARRIRNSAIPEYQQGVSQLVTVVDNVQDAALTASVGARVTMPVLGRFGDWLAPAVLAMGRIAVLLNWLNSALMIFGVLYAAACQGPRQAVAQYSVKNLAGAGFGLIHAILPRSRGIPGPRPGAGLKPRMAATMTGIPQGRALAGMKGSRWGLARISFGEALQAAQVAADVTGYGLSLGAVMGFIGETAYAAERLTRGEHIRVRSPRVNHTFAELTHERIHALSSAALWHRQQCCRALAAAPFVLRDPETFGDDFYALTWLTVYVSIEPLMWDTQGIRWRDQIIAGLPASWAPWEMTDTVSRGIVAELGLDPDAHGAWPIPGAPPQLDAQRLVLELGPEISRALQRWLDAAPFDPLRRFVAELSVRVTERFWFWLEGHDEYPRWQLAPPTAVWESLFLADRFPILSDPPERLVAAWAACEQYVTDSGRKYIDAPILDQLWAQHGTPLLRIREDTAPVSPELLLPWNEETGAVDDVAFGATLDEARARLQQPPPAPPRQ